RHPPPRPVEGAGRPVDAEKPDWYKPTGCWGPERAFPFYAARIRADRDTQLPSGKSPRRVFEVVFMYAIVNIAGVQMRATREGILDVPRLAAEPGATITFDQ